MVNFVKVIGGLFSLGFIYFGLYFAFKPIKAIQALQRMKYKETGEPRKIEKTFSIVFGSILALIGGYLLVIVILSFIYPA
jgi:fatty acid desaturase